MKSNFYVNIVLFVIQITSGVPAGVCEDVKHITCFTWSGLAAPVCNGYGYFNHPEQTRKILLYCPAPGADPCRCACNSVVFPAAVQSFLGICLHQLPRNLANNPSIPGPTSPTEVFCPVFYHAGRKLHPLGTHGRGVPVLDPSPIPSVVAFFSLLVITGLVGVGLWKYCSEVDLRARSCISRDRLVRVEEGLADFRSSAW